MSECKNNNININDSKFIGIHRYKYNTDYDNCKYWVEKLKIKCNINIGWTAELRKTLTFYNNDRKQEFTYDALVCKARKVAKTTKVTDYMII